MCKPCPDPLVGNAALQAAIEAVRAVENDEDLDDVTNEVIEDAMRQPAADLTGLTLMRPLGLGGQGGVWLATDATGLKLAVKEVRKGRIAALPNKSAQRVWMEREALMELTGHPFLTRLHGTCQCDSSLYFAMSLARGGDLFALLDTMPQGLPEAQANFYTAGIALALRHAHSHGYLFRDMKLENILIDEQGYALLCDFGYAKKIASNRTYTKCGTDEYAPPEVVNGFGRSTAADWWGLGVLLHELLLGHPPFGGATGREVFDRISQYCRGGERAEARLQAELRAAARRASPPLSVDSTNFLCGLLQATEAERIGCGPSGFIGVQTHAWFSELDWAAMLRKQLPAPWLPPKGSEGGTYLSHRPDFSGCDVLNELKYDRAVWDPLFAPFGPYVTELRRPALAAA